MFRLPHFGFVRPYSTVSTLTPELEAIQDSAPLGEPLRSSIDKMLLSGVVPGDLSSSTAEYDDDGTPDVDINCCYMDKFERRQAMINKGVRTSLADALARAGAPVAPGPEPTAPSSSVGASKTDTSAQPV